MDINIKKVGIMLSGLSRFSKEIKIYFLSIKDDKIKKLNEDLWITLTIDLADLH